MQRPWPSMLMHSGRQGKARSVAKRRTATWPEAGQANGSRKCGAARSYTFIMHLLSLSPLLSSPGWGGWCGGRQKRETREPRGATCFAAQVHALISFPASDCKCRASASLRVLAKRCYNRGRTTGPEGPLFFAEAAHGAVGGGCTCSSQGR